MKALIKFTDNAIIFVYAGDICRNMKRFDEAFQYWNKALSLDDTFLDAKYSIGFCYEEIGEYGKAYETWMELADELGKRGLVVEKDFPLELAKNICKRIEIQKERRE